MSREKLTVSGIVRRDCQVPDGGHAAAQRMSMERVCVHIRPWSWGCLTMHLCMRTVGEGEKIFPLSMLYSPAGPLLIRLARDKLTREKENRSLLTCALYMYTWEHLMTSDPKG